MPALKQDFYVLTFYRAALEQNLCGNVEQHAMQREI
jgi:hypothetical protein